MGAKQSVIQNEIRETHALTKKVFSLVCCVEDWAAVIKRHILSISGSSDAEKAWLANSTIFLNGKTQMAQLSAQDMTNVIIDVLLPIIHLQDVMETMEMNARLEWNKMDPSMTGGGGGKGSAVRKGKARLISCNLDCKTTQNEKDVQELLEQTLTAFHFISRWNRSAVDKFYGMFYERDPTLSDPASKAWLKKQLSRVEELKKEADSVLNDLLGTLKNLKRKVTKCFDSVTAIHMEIRDRFGADMYDLQNASKTGGRWK